jgi:hypothetical protein
VRDQRADVGGDALIVFGPREQHHRARARALLDPAIGGQRVERAADGDPADGEAFGQPVLAGQARAGRKRSVGDLVAQRQVDAAGLPAFRQRRLRVDRHVRLAPLFAPEC